MRTDYIALLRRWRARPALPALALVVLVTGVAAGATVLGATYAALLRPLPYPRAGQLVLVQSDFPGMKLRGIGMSGPEASELADFAGALSASGFGFASSALIDAGGGPVRADLARVSVGFLEALRPALSAGQMFSAADDVPAGPCRVVVSRRFGDDVLGGAANAFGRTIRIDSESCDVIGVWANRVAFLGAPADVWAPLRYDVRSPTANRANHAFAVVARVADGVTLDAARADLARAVEGWTRATGQLHSPSPAFHPLTLTPLVDIIRGPVRGAAIVLLIAVATLLVVTIANASALLVADADHRRAELVLRAALGADGRRLWRLHALEAGTLGALAGVLGGAAALGGSRWIASAAPTGLANLDLTLPPWQTATVAAAVAAIAAIVCSLFQASRIPWRGLAAALGDDSRTGTASASRQRLRRLLVGVEVALAVTLVAGSAVMLQSVWQLAHVELGYRPEGVLRAQVNLPADRYDTRARIDAFYDAVATALRQRGGVTAAGVVTGLLPERRPNYMSIVVNGATGDPHLGTPPIQFVQFLTPDAFPALGLTLRRGRLLDATDTATAQPVVVVNERAAEVYFDDGDPIGRQIRPMGMNLSWMTIVGVVADARQNGVGREAGTEMFVPLAQAANALGTGAFTRDMNIVMRVDGDDIESNSDAIQRAVREVDPAAAVSQIETLSAVVARTTAAPRFLMVIICAFAIVSLLLAAAGIYGIVTHTVALRAREIGVRRSLGASGAAIGLLIGRQIIGLVAGGLAVGVALAAAGTTLLAPFAFQTSVGSASRLALIAASVMLVAAVACARPLARALRVDPAIVLRQ